jgi:hypothetical protein
MKEVIFAAFIDDSYQVILGGSLIGDYLIIISAESGRRCTLNYLYIQQSFS